MKKASLDGTNRTLAPAQPSVLPAKKAAAQPQGCGEIPMGPSQPVPSGTTPSLGRPKKQSITETIPFSSDADKQAAIDAFKSRNGDSWTFMPLNTFGIVTAADSNIASGPDKNLPQDQATAIARDFLTKNADLFGYTAEDIAAATPSPLKEGAGWSIEFQGTRVPAGYEGIEGAERQIGINIMLNVDGSLRRIDNQSEELTTSNLLPHLTISTKPAFASDSAKVSKAVVGKKLEWVTGGDEGQKKVTTEFGNVAAADIKSRALMLNQDWQNGKVVVTLAFDIRVDKGGHEWSFLVDAGTGKLMGIGQEGF